MPLYPNQSTMMAEYHVWATRRLLALLAPLSEEELRRDCRLFFGSIFGTLNHLLLAERLWYARFTGESFPITGLDQILLEETDALYDALQAQAAAWVTLVGSYDEEQLHASFTYRNTENIEMRGIRVQLLAHIFNHGTHHRGQISAAMTQLGHPAPEIDLLYFLNPDA